MLYFVSSTDLPTWLPGNIFTVAARRSDPNFTNPLLVVPALFTAQRILLIGIAHLANAFNDQDVLSALSRQPRWSE